MWNKHLDFLCYMLGTAEVPNTSTMEVRKFFYGLHNLSVFPLIHSKKRVFLKNHAPIHATDIYI